MGTSRALAARGAARSDPDRDLVLRLRPKPADDADRARARLDRPRSRHADSPGPVRVRSALEEFTIRIETPDGTECDEEKAVAFDEAMMPSDAIRPHGRRRLATRCWIHPSPSRPGRATSDTDSYEKITDAFLEGHPAGNLDSRHPSSRSAGAGIRRSRGALRLFPEHVRLRTRVRFPPPPLQVSSQEWIATIDPNEMAGRRMGQIGH